MYHILVLIPSWLILTEAMTTAVILAVLLVRFRDWIAGALFLPVAYLCVIYFFVENLTIEDARLYVRYGQTVLFLGMIIVFGRILCVKLQCGRDK